MNAKEKAKELLDKMSCQTYSFQEYAGAHYSTDEIGWEAGKKCAIIFIDGILDLFISEFKWDKKHNGNIHFWQEVKQEIEKL
jgi:hypothetical protein